MIKSKFVYDLGIASGFWVSTLPKAGWVEGDVDRHCGLHFALDLIARGYRYPGMTPRRHATNKGSDETTT